MTATATRTLRHLVTAGLEDAATLEAHPGWPDAKRLMPEMIEEFDVITSRMREIREALGQGGHYDVPTTLQLTEGVRNMLGHMARLREILDLREYGPPKPPAKPMLN
jgi:hypothetical protein